MAKVAFKNGVTSVILRVKLLDSSSTTGAGKTGLTFSSSGLIISTIADNEASATVYTSAGSTTETVTTLGTFAAPTATKCRFKEVDATNHPGLYEIQIADARYAVSNARSVIISVQCTGAVPVDAEVQLQTDDPYTAKPSNFATMVIDGSGYVRVQNGTASGQISTTNGQPNINQSAAYPGVIIAGTIAAGLSTAENGVTVAGMNANVIGASQFGADAITSTVLASSAVVEIAGGVWDEARSGHTTAGTFGAGVITTYAIKKNTAFTAFEFVMTDSTSHAPATGKTITATRSIDGAAFGACTNSAVEISDGAYKINFSAADLNGNNILFKFAATGCDDRFIQIVTQTG